MNIQITRNEMASMGEKKKERKKRRRKSPGLNQEYTKNSGPFFSNCSKKLKR